MSARKPCWMRVLSLCFFLFFTFWVTSWKSAREASTSRLLCFTTGFPGSPMGLPPQHFSFSSNPCIGPVIERKFGNAKGAEPVGFSHRDFDFDVEALNHAAGELFFGFEVVEDEFPMGP